MSKTSTQKFVKLFRFLFKDESYTDLDVKSKLLYALLTDKQCLSQANVESKNKQSQYLDSNNRVFSIYNNQDLKKALNISEPSVIKLKKELIKHDLLEEVRQGHNQPNRLYPKKPYDQYWYEHDTDDYYYLPKSLFTNKHYSNLSAESKVAYAVYLNRFKFSLKESKFVDDDNKIYCTYTNENLANLLKISTKKVERIKKQLIVTGLLVNKKSHFGKANRLYVNLPKPTRRWELKICPYGNLKYVRTGTQNMSVQELKICRSSYTDINYTDTNYTDTSYTNDLNLPDTSNELQSISKAEHSNHSNHNFNNSNENETKDYLLQNFPQNLKAYLENFSVREIKIIKSQILKAKRQVNSFDTEDTIVTLENSENQILKAIKRIKTIKINGKKEKVEDLESYIFATVREAMISVVSELKFDITKENLKESLNTSPLADLFN